MLSGEQPLTSSEKCYIANCVHLVRQLPPKTNSLR